MEKGEEGDPVWIILYAEWCPSCRTQDTNIQSSSADIPTDVTIFKLEFDDVVELRQKYGVTIQHTFVQIDDDGNEIQQWNSLYKEDDLKSILDRI